LKTSDIKKRFRSYTPGSLARNGPAPGEFKFGHLVWYPKGDVLVPDHIVRRRLTIWYENLGVEPMFVKEYLETEHHLIVPRRFFGPPLLNGQDIFHYGDYLRRFRNDRLPLRTTFSLWDDQVAPYDAMLASVETGGGILHRSCGAGKTVLAIKLAETLNVPTAVITDQLGILEQWGESAKKFLGLRDDEIGLVGDGVFDYKKPLVLCSATTVGRNYHCLPTDFYHRFGLVIFDEAHHTPARIYRPTLKMFGGIRIALTATFNRPDKLEKLCLLHIGPILYEDLSTQLDYDLYVVRTGLRPKVPKDIGTYWVSLGKNEKRNEMILDVIYALRAAGRRTLVIGFSKDQLKMLHEQVENSGIIIAEVNFRDRPSVLRNHDVTFGIWKCARDGLDAQNLDAVLFISPFKDLNGFIQGSGRSLRKKDGKKKPLIIIFRDGDNRSYRLVNTLLNKLKESRGKEPAGVMKSETMVEHIREFR